MRASDKAYRALRQDIVEWRLLPGTVLAEVEQADRLGISRTPVREAIARLVADGLASQQGGRGTVVSEVSPAHVDDLFALRRALEVESARLAAAARRGTGGAADGFAELAARFRDAARTLGDGPAGREDYYVLAGELDAAIDAAVANPYIGQALRQLRLHLDRVRRLSQDDPARLRESAAEHAAIAAAIAAGDPERAAAATLVHLAHSLDNIKTHAPEKEGTA